MWLATCTERMVNVTSSDNDHIVNVRDLKMYFAVRRGFLQRRVAQVKAVDGLNFAINRGEVLGLVGESGSGKTTTGRCILMLYRPTGGQIYFEGRNLTHLSETELRPLRRRMSLVFQDPYGSLDPRQTAGSIVGEPLKVHRLVNNRRQRRERIAELFRIVGLDPSMAGRVPHEFSGGQRQRIGVARALASEASLIVCDEPVSALDVSIQAQILNLLQELSDKIEGLTYLFIAHDLSVVKHISTRIAVMYLGRIVEVTTKKSLYDNPLHPYTQALISAVPVADPFLEEKRERIILQGEVPSPLNPPTGCAFHPRCPVAFNECRSSTPALRDVGEGHEVACFRAAGYY